jgi:hypothetical protein
VSCLAGCRQEAREGGGADDGNFPVPFQAQEVLVSGDDVIRMTFAGAGEDVVVIRVPGRPWDLQPPGNHSGASLQELQHVANVLWGQAIALGDLGKVQDALDLTEDLQ